MFMQYEPSILKVNKLEFFNELPKGDNELRIELQTNVMIPGDLEEKYFMLKFNLDVCSHDEKFKFKLTATTRVTYVDDIQTLDAVKQNVDETIPNILPEISKLVKKITEDFGITPLDIPF